MIHGYASTVLFRSVIIGFVVLLASATPGGSVRAQKLAPDAEAPLISVAHFAPFSDTIPRSYVAVLLDGQPVGRPIQYLGAIADIELSQGTHDLEIDPVDWPGKVVTDSVTAVADMDVTFALIGGTADVPLQFVEYPNNAVDDPDNAQVRLHNFAPVAFSGDSEITLCNENNEPFLDMSSVLFPNSTAYTLAPPGIYILHIAPASTECQTPVGPTDFAVEMNAGQVVDLIFSGLGDATHPLAVVQYDQGLHRRWPYTAYLPTLLASGN